MKFTILLLLATSAQAVKLMAGRANHKQLAQVKSKKALKLSQLKHKEGQYIDEEDADFNDTFGYAQVSSKKALKLSQLKHKQEEDDEEEDDEAPTWAEVSAMLDTNGDGKISAEEAGVLGLSPEELTQFAGFAGDDGLLDEAEFNAAIASGLAQISSKSKKLMKLAQIKQDPTWESVTAGLDTNKDNSISRQEALDAGVSEEELAHFDQYAVDGTLDEAGFNAAMAALAQVSTKQPPTPDDAFGALDLDNNGMISEDEAKSAVEAGTISMDDVEHFGEFVGDDEQLSMDEYYKGLAALAQVSTKKAVKLSQLKTKAKEITWAELAERVDANEDASISVEEIEKAGLRLDTGEMAAFKEFAGEDGSLNEEEFNAFIASFD